MILVVLEWVGVGAKNPVIERWLRGSVWGRNGAMPLMFQERMRRADGALGARWGEGGVAERGFVAREDLGEVDRRRRLRGGGEREGER